MKTSYPPTEYQPSLDEFRNISTFKEKEKMKTKLCKISHLFVKLQRKRQPIGRKASVQLPINSIKRYNGRKFELRQNQQNSQKTFKLINKKQKKQ